ncbi:hypothetical protein [Actinoplanes lobatus]|uniref:Uncharacterized protein n=2 Tax=Actinoplanes lobatus TaxID=113568 RepID=A0A7W7HIM9_9ACTN|nr:hypothetical protein [Actinoplanes lobatus]MBB4751214.1 hypothetical protein [Actinoplanes lobatus]
MTVPGGFMPPISRFQYAPRVDHRMFVLLDPRSRPTPLDEGLPEHDEILRAGQHGVVFRSGGDLFRPAVTIERWAADPGTADGEWDEVAEASLSAPSGRLRLRSIMGEPAGPDLEVEGSQRLRAHTRGRGEAMERLTVETGYAGVEEWLIQLWPTRA